MSSEDLLDRWNNNDIPFEERDILLKELETKGLFPKIMEAMDEWESEAGLYPDTEDPRFTEKLMRKLEFSENRQASIKEQQEDEVNPCDPEREFELTPVQRFIGRFLSPQCPYQSALLYHGVGVGKTCAAVTVAENYLRSFPRRTVIIVAPRNIQSGFKRTIFDDEALVIPQEEGAANVPKGCTGMTYLTRTGTEFEKDRNIIAKRITQAINSRYTFMGYIQFQKYIDELLKGTKDLPDDRRKAAQDKILRREFSGRLLIIDEAHNLRDTPGEVVEDDADNPGGETELSEAAAGKKLTPSLMKVLEVAEGMKFLLLTGTPMYNSFKEIVFLMNLLLLNDKKATLSERDIFLPNGLFKKAAGPGKRGGEELLGGVANAYVSFMRGENPLSFPVRLRPEDTTPLTEWPTVDPIGGEVSQADRERVVRLPFVPVEYEGATQALYQRISEDSIVAGGVGVNSIDEMVQSGNWIFPGEEGQQIRDAGFDASFEDRSGGAGVSAYRARGGVAPKWLLASQLGTVSPKAKFTIERVRNSQGIAFVYSRFIKSGALPLALALEANGYTAWGRDRPLLENGIQDDQGRQCALCSKREKLHQGSKHKFVPAKYVLITGKASISPNNPVAIQAARAKTNIDGREIKVVIGSSVASEGVDFRFIREIYVFDSWFHLNKMEQVLGRGIRTCSHALLPQEQRNCTIYLLVNRFAGGEDTETADMYMYRRGMVKAVEVGRVTRTLKRYALDCNLNRDAIIVSGLDTQRHVDSQGKERPEVDVNDTPFTNLCDWIETCEYTCAKPVDMDEEGGVDTSTYDEYAVRWRENQLKGAIKTLFKERQQPIFQLAEIQNMFSAVPAHIIAGLLSEIVGNQAFRLTIGSVEGYIVYRNGYYLFQPDHLSDLRIPLALRVADVPVKRDIFNPSAMKVAGVGVGVGAIGTAAVPAAPAVPTASGAVAQPTAASLDQYWNAISRWAKEMKEGGLAQLDDIPGYVKTAIEARYIGDEITKETDFLIMINWMNEYISKNEGYEPDKKAKYNEILSKVLLEHIWDENLKANEQMALIKGGDEMVKQIAREQIVKKDNREAFRYIDTVNGALKYVCGDAPCSDAVTRVFDGNQADPILKVKVNKLSTGPIYGFIAPKTKDNTFVFKTNEQVPDVGKGPEKGKECANISNIQFHTRMLKDIGEMLSAEGYPRFLLIDEILDEKARRKKEKEEAKAAGRGAGGIAPKNPKRVYENSIRACALKNIMLRWMDLMGQDGERQAKGEGAKKYFYRPIAALKTGHK